jgi:hypothetical protein
MFKHWIGKPSAADGLKFLKKCIDMILFKPSDPIMALSWKQPFGTAMLYGKIETRTWNTKYRGWVLICTSKQPYALSSVLNICGDDLYQNMINKIKYDPTAFLYGYAIAVGKLIDCRPMQRKDEEKTFVQWQPGMQAAHLYCHVYEQVQAIQPFPWMGVLGFKELNDYRDDATK